jgi:hypothetical protein
MEVEILTQIVKGDSLQKNHKNLDTLSCLDFFIYRLTKLIQNHPL